MKLVIDRLGKQYKNGGWGLRQVSLSMEAGVLGLIGPAGDGKTTLMRMLATVTPPTEGRITWDGQDVCARPGAFRRMLGYLPQNFGAYAGLSGRDFLLYIAALKGLANKAGRARAAKVLEQVGLSEVSGHKIGEYTKEMQRRIGLAQALLDEPSLLLIDELGAVKDAQERARFCDLLAQEASRRFVVVATDSISDVTAVAMAAPVSVALLKGGRLIAYAAPAELVRAVRDPVWLISIDQTELGEWKGRSGRKSYLISRIEHQGRQSHLRIIAAQKPHPDAILVNPTLEDAYIYHSENAESGVQP